MVTEGDRITIKYSKLLDERGLSALVNKTGVVTRVIALDKRVIGVCANVKVYRHTKSYYIPVCSIEEPNKINKTRVLGILKSTIL